MGEILKEMSRSASSFIRFPLLPTELRLKIWSYASRARRVLELQYCLVDRMFFTFQHIPAILHTNQESREVGLLYYHLSFGTDRYPPSTYYNPVDDIIYFGSRNENEVADMIAYFRKYSDALDPGDKIQTLAIAQHMWSRTTRSCGGRPFALRRGSRSIQRFHEAFPSLKQLIFVKAKDYGRSYDEEEGVESAYEDYSGISLVDSESDLGLLTDPELALEAVISTFETDRRRRPHVLYPEVVFMEYGFENSGERVKDH